MRYYGTITRWNSKRGFGAATIEDTGQEIFLALAAFTTLTRLPKGNTSPSTSQKAGAAAKKPKTSASPSIAPTASMSSSLPPKNPSPANKPSSA